MGLVPSIPLLAILHGCSSHPDGQSSSVWSLLSSCDGLWCPLGLGRSWSAQDCFNTLWEVLLGNSDDILKPFRCSCLQKGLLQKAGFAFCPLKIFILLLVIPPIQFIILFGSLWLVAMEITSYGNDANVITE